MITGDILNVALLPPTGDFCHPLQGGRNAPAFLCHNIGGHPTLRLSPAVIMQGSTAPPQQHQRRQSAVKAPPMLPPGMPVRAREAQQTNNQSGVYKQSLPQPPPKQSHPVAHRQHDRVDQSQYASYRSSTTSSRSPPTSHDSFHGAQGGIRESTRVNIKGSAPPAPIRQVSATMSWESDYKSPREPDIVTPKEQYTPQINVRDQVDHQFESLLVGL